MFVSLPAIKGLGFGNLSQRLLLVRMVKSAPRPISKEGRHARGYRLIVNTGADGGQTVFHLHLHLIGGQRMRQPMG